MSIRPPLYPRSVSRAAHGRRGALDHALRTCTHSEGRS